MKKRVSSDRTYFVVFNGKLVASYKRIKNALAFIERKGLEDTHDHRLMLCDDYGEEYDWSSGQRISEILV